MLRWAAAGEAVAEVEAVIMVVGVVVGSGGGGGGGVVVVAAVVVKVVVVAAAAAVVVVVVVVHGSSRITPGCRRKRDLVHIHAVLRGAGSEAGGCFIAKFRDNGIIHDIHDIGDNKGTAGFIVTFYGHDDDDDNE